MRPEVGFILRQNFSPAVNQWNHTCDYIPTQWWQRHRFDNSSPKRLNQKGERSGKSQVGPRTSKSISVRSLGSGIPFFGYILCPPGPLGLHHTHTHTHTHTILGLGLIPTALLWWGPCPKAEASRSGLLKPRRCLHDLWITVRVISPSYWRIEHFHSQIGLLFHPVKHSTNHPSFCPI